MQLNKNQKAPQFSALNHDGIEISLNDFGEKIIILYFYPKDLTKGCSIESREFSELFEKFQHNNAVVVGISPDSIKSHQKFIQKEHLKQMLISDEDKKIAQSYGVWVEKSMYGRKYMGILRSTFIIQNGIIKEAFYNVKAASHAQKILDFIQGLN